MKIQMLSGGLGNQILQYIFVRFAERRDPRQNWIFDDTYFFTDHAAHNGYELAKVFGVHANLMSRCLDQDTWHEILRLKKRGAFLPQILLDTGLPIVLAEEARHGFFRGITISRIPSDTEIWNLPYSNVYYHAYWLEDYWFAQDREENRRELTFPPLTDIQNLKYADKIKQTASVGIHVRRGDFVKLGWNVPVERYRSACERALEQFADVCFFVFSDDLAWCRAHAEEMGLDLAGHTIYVEGNIQGKNYMDMQLMSMCQGMIRPEKSTFSQVAGWLNQDLRFEIKL